MALKLIKIIGLPDAGKTARNVKIKRDNETDEYVCQLYISGAHYEAADYFTDYLEDAETTAKHMCIAPKGK